MQNSVTELDAANALLEHGIKVQVTAPLLFRLFGKRTVPVVIRPPFMGTLYRISAINSRAGITEGTLEALEAMPVDQLNMNYIWPMAKVAATAILNNHLGCVLFTLPLAAWLKWHMKQRQLMSVSAVINKLNGKKAFMNTIRLAAGLHITTPNLSQENQGS
jgi:hypothetical protein